MSYFGNDYSCTIKHPSGKIAWRARDISQALVAISEKHYVILGGDVVTLEMQYTNDSWFYQPVWKCSDNYISALQGNIEESISYANEYINSYIRKHGENFLFLFIVCDGTQAMLRATQNNARSTDIGTCRN